MAGYDNIIYIEREENFYIALLRKNIFALYDVYDIKLLLYRKYQTDRKPLYV